MTWNVRGLNSSARRNVVHDLVAQERISLLSLQETKLQDCTLPLVLETCGADFDFICKPAVNTCGGILLAWRRDAWSVTSPVIRSFSLTAKITLLHCNVTWWCTCVYGPQSDQDKLLFLEELR